jgi:hypothetical protein
MEIEMDMETEKDMETETDMETERKLTIHGHGHGHGHRHGHGIGAIWNAFEIGRRNFQCRYILVVPLQYENKSYRCWNSFQNDVLAELEISV